MDGASKGFQMSREESRTVEPFHSLILEGIGTVHVSQEPGMPERLVIRAPSHLIDRIVSVVEEGVLRLSLRGRGSGFPNQSAEIRYDVSMRDVRRLSIDGAGTIETTRLEADGLALDIDGAGTIRIPALRARSLDVDVDGSGKLALADCRADQCSVQIDGSGKLILDDVTIEELRLTIDGAGKARAQGVALRLRVDIDGTGRVDFRALQAETASVSIGGVGTVVTAVSGALDVRIDGYGKVQYVGDPRLTTKISSFGQVARLRDEVVV
jgi:hypothetical protein